MMKAEKNKIIEFIGDLDNKEQEIIHNLLCKVRKGGKISEFSVIHESLKLDLEDMMKEGLKFQEISSMKAPPLVKSYNDVEKILLPQNYLPLPFSLDKILKARRSKREYSGRPLSLEEISTLLYFSYGIRSYISAYNTSKFPLRMAPSSGGLQAIELYLVVNKIDGLKKGIYHYNPIEHSLELIYEGNFRRKLVNLCVNQEFIHDSSAIIMLSCVMERLLWKYKIRAYRYIHMDAGFVGENIYLVATALKLGTCAIAGFFENELNDLLDIDGKNEFITLLMSVGKLQEKKKS